MIKYLGSKKKLLDDIYQAAIRSGMKGNDSFLDVFSGTCRVGHHFKKQGHLVYANDLGTYAYCIAQCLIEGTLKHKKDALELISELNEVKGKDGWFTQTYCRDSWYFQEKNGKKIDAIREVIEEKHLEPVLKSILLTSLMLAADAVDSTCGVQMAYLKKPSARSNNDLKLELPQLLDGPAGKAYNMDAVNIGKEVGKVDVAYLDPPYNQHSYLGNYHIWESLVRWDKPKVYGIAKKREDVKERKSDFNKKGEITKALKDTITNIDARLFIISFNDEGFLTQDEITQALKETDKGEVHCQEIEYKRYVGAQIGIYDNKGKKVGKVSHLKNHELIFTIGGKKERTLEDFIVDT